VERLAEPATAAVEEFLVPLHPGLAGCLVVFVRRSRFKPEVEAVRGGIVGPALYSHSHGTLKQQNPSGTLGLRADREQREQQQSTSEPAAPRRAGIVRPRDEDTHACP
jgi:hypothetical protein